MNEADSEMMLRMLDDAGWEVSGEAALADVVLLNTCAVRERAEERVASRVRQLALLKRYRPDLRIGVAGCMAKHLGKDLLRRLPAVDLLIGPDSYRRLADDLARSSSEGPLVDLALDKEERYEGLPAVRPGARHAWIPIMRGCDRFCTFCVVPLVRGREKSLPAEEIVRQVEEAVSAGANAVTLLGQTVNSYRDSGTDFARLLDRVARVPGLRRIRYTSPHPADFTPEVFEVMARHENLCKQIHLPVQSGSDRILAAMKRGHTRRQFLEVVDRIRSVLPDAAITTDLIAGFPSETEEEFEATLSLLLAVRFDGAFLFRYSPRPGTFAYRHQADDVPEASKADRLTRMIALQAVSYTHLTLP
ncbi:MAG: tRNA (N6-isopentenyl adenosine(37)-C2)-methylthiotransferase MiaB, partial [Candidatus Eisenbacteria bacterium]|nr:tRNA (N6-isopentenyl adenosine(37)-C2)-methylthiotransferase MiaB [Candidatus Eisenbacteria bacterium]